VKLSDRRTLRSRLRVALLPLLLLGAVPAPGLALCAQSDTRHHTCCCPAHDGHEAASAQLSSSCCCKFEQGRTHSQPSTALRAENRGAHALSLATSESAGALPRLRGALSSLPPLREARVGPKLFILHRSLLI